MSAANRDGPNVVNQVVHAATFYGHVARCGCGWKTVHESHIAGLVAGQRHLWNVHGVAPETLEPKDGAA